MISSSFDFDLDPSTNIYEAAIVLSTVHPLESIFPIRRLNIGSSAWLRRRGMWAKRRGGDERGKHYNKSAKLWHECKIAGTDLVVYNTRGLERDELASCKKGGRRRRGWSMDHCESYLSCYLQIYGRGEENRRSVRGGRSYWPIIDGYCLY